MIDGIASRFASFQGPSYVAAFCAFCGSIGWLIANHHLRTAMATTLLVVCVWLITHRRALAVLLGATLPFPASLVGHSANIAASDIMLVLLFGLLVVDFVVGIDTDIWRHLRPLLIAAFAYTAWMLVVLARHLSVEDLAQSVQRVELYLIPAAIGIKLARSKQVTALLRGYLVAATVLAALYPLTSTASSGAGVNKNPAGQFIANAILLVIALPALRRTFIWCVPILTLGLLWTQSRGSILAVAVGIIVLVLLSPGRERRRYLLMTGPIVLVALGAFALLPEEAKERNTDFSASSGTAAARSIEYRQQYADEAWQMIRAEPVFGVGIGGYQRGLPEIVRPTSSDPHQLLLLITAEGGYVMTVGFFILVLGAFTICWWHRRSMYAPVACAITAATVGHGLVDVYWVRGTPIMGWLMMGFVLGSVSLDRGGRRADARRAVNRSETATAACPS